MNELAVKVSVVPGKIECNMDATREYIKGVVKAYDGAAFSEESKREAKGELASLRKMKDALESRRKEVKVEWLKPYEEFETQVKELVNLINQPISLIDTQIKEMEKRRKEEKRGKICEFFGDIASDILEYVSLDKIYDSRWENASVSEKAWKADISNAVQKVRNDIDVIKMNPSDAVPQALETYKTSMNLGMSLAVISSYERQKEDILKRQEEKKRAEEEQKRKQEEERIRKEEREKIAAQQAANDKFKGFGMPEPVGFDATGFDVECVLDVDDVLSFDAGTCANYQIWGTEEEFKQLEMFLDSVGMSYKRG